MSKEAVTKEAVTELLADLLSTVRYLAGDLEEEGQLTLLNHALGLIEDIAARLGTSMNDVWRMEQEQ